MGSPSLKDPCCMQAAPRSATAACEAVWRASFKAEAKKSKANLAWEHFGVYVFFPSKRCHMYCVNRKS